jgi:hypothetical protein
MTKDILVDNTAAKNFANPLDSQYKALIAWLFETGTLVVTQRLLSDYYSTSAAATSNTSIPALVNRLLSDGRLKQFTRRQLRAFRFPRSVALRSNWNDHDNVKAVMLSERKLALSHDANFRYDVNHFPGCKAMARGRPQDLPYR